MTGRRAARAEHRNGGGGSDEPSDKQLEMQRLRVSEARFNARTSENSLKVIETKKRVLAAERRLRYEPVESQPGESGKKRSSRGRREDSMAAARPRSRPGQHTLAGAPAQSAPAIKQIARQMTFHFRFQHSHHDL